MTAVNRGRLPTTERMLLTVPEAADLLGCGRSFLYGLMSKRQLPRVKLGRLTRIPMQALPVPDARLTVASYLADWLGASKSTVRAQTWRAYERHLRLHVIPFIGRGRLAQLQPTDLHRLYSARMDSGLSSTTVRHVHVI